MAKSQVRISVNGRAVEALVEPRTLLIHFLREQLNLTGAHIGCDTTHCGACTVDLDGKSVKSCTMLGWEGYAPIAQGMQAALPHVDLFAPAHNLKSLAALEPYLARL